MRAGPKRRTWVSTWKRTTARHVRVNCMRARYGTRRLGAHRRVMVRWRRRHSTVSDVGVGTRLDRPLCPLFQVRKAARPASASRYMDPSPTSAGRDASSSPMTPSNGSRACHSAAKASAPQPMLGPSTVSAEAIHRPFTSSRRTSTQNAEQQRRYLSTSASCTTLHRLSEVSCVRCSLHPEVADTTAGRTGSIRYV